LVLIRQVFPVVLTQPDEPAADLPMEGVTKLSIPDLGQWSRDQGGVPASTGSKRFRLRVVVGRLATLKVDQASIAEAQFSLAA